MEIKVATDVTVVSQNYICCSCQVQIAAGQPCLLRKGIFQYGKLEASFFAIVCSACESKALHTWTPDEWSAASYLCYALNPTGLMAQPYHAPKS